MGTKVEVKTIPLHGLFIHRKQVWRSLGKLRAESHSTTAQKVFMNEHNTEVSTENSFKEGAKWAINEFLKDLWHPAKDIPEEERPVLVVYKHGGYSIVYWEAYNISGQVNYWTLDITQWLYVDELFPKEGGEHD